MAVYAGWVSGVVVERVSEQMMRVTYVSVEAGDMHLGGDSEGEGGNFGRSPWLLYEMHVRYAQSLLLGAVKGFEGRDGNGRTKWRWLRCGFGLN